MTLTAWHVDNVTGDLKREFAEELLRAPTAAFDIALRLSLGNYEHATRRSQSWPSDPLVVAHQKDLLAAHGEEYFLPSKAQIAWDLYFMAHEKTEYGKHKLDGKDRIAALAAHAKIRGFDDEQVSRGVVENHVKILFVSPDKNPSFGDAKIIENDNNSLLPQIRFAK